MKQEMQDAFNGMINDIVSLCDSVIEHKNLMTVLEIGLVEQIKMSIESYKTFKAHNICKGV